jgi:K+-dependent Na+/Ca+ exchanger-like protein
LLAVVCDEFFVASLDEIIDRLKMPSDVAGATFMAVGSSAPELFTSLIAVLRPGGVADVGAGTIVGSAIFNILVIIGASALFRQAKLNWQPVVRDSLFYALSIIVLLWAFWDGKIYLWESLIFIGMYAVYLVAVVKWRKWFPYKESEDPIEIMEEASEKNVVAKWSKKLLGLVIPDANKNKDKYLITFGMSIVFIAALSWVLVESAVEIGHVIGISPVIISLTVLAAGTSIPDLLSSMAVAKKGRGDMAISNAVGSNIFDILFGLGVPWMIVLIFGVSDHVAVATENLMASVFLLFATLLSVFFLLAFREWKIGPKAGWLLIGIYLIYLGYNVWGVLG